MPIIQKNRDALHYQFPFRDIPEMGTAWNCELSQGYPVQQETLRRAVFCRQQSHPLHPLVSFLPQPMCSAVCGCRGTRASPIATRCWRALRKADRSSAIFRAAPTRTALLPAWSSSALASSARTTERSPSPAVAANLRNQNRRSTAATPAQPCACWPACSRPSRSPALWSGTLPSPAGPWSAFARHSLRWARGSSSRTVMLL